MDIEIKIKPEDLSEDYLLKVKEYFGMHWATDEEIFNHLNELKITTTSFDLDGNLIKLIYEN